MKGSSSLVHLDTGLSKYLTQINKLPILSQEEEYSLAIKWHEDNDITAAHTLISSHLRLVPKIALKFSGYGLPLTDVIAEGNLGLMHALRKFNPYMGNRFSTYAMWWVKAYIQDYVLKSWSLVKVGTSAAKKKLFYNLNKIKNRLLNNNEKMNDTHFDTIARELNVSHSELKDINNLMVSKETSLNSYAYDNDETELIDLIADNSENQEHIMIEKDDRQHKQEMISNAMNSLSDREQDIIKARLLEDRPLTLEVLSQKYNISCERVRQIESKALSKLKTHLLTVN